MLVIFILLAKILIHMHWNYQRANYKIKPDKMRERNSCRTHWCTIASGKLRIFIFCLFHESCTTDGCSASSFVALAANVKHCIYILHALKNSAKTKSWHIGLQMAAIPLIFFDTITKHITHWTAYLCFLKVLIHFQLNKRLRLKNTVEDISSDF